MFKDRFQHDDLENLMEELVFEQIAILVDEGEEKIPLNDIGIQDIAALALNHLPAKYCCSIIDKRLPRPELLAELTNYKPLVRDKVLAAIDQVNSFPHHN